MCIFSFLDVVRNIIIFTKNLKNINIYFSKSTEDREEVDGDRENLLDTELLPAEDFPPDFPISLRNLDTDPALRIQRWG